VSPIDPRLGVSIFSKKTAVVFVGKLASVLGYDCFAFVLLFVFPYWLILSTIG